MSTHAPRVPSKWRFQNRVAYRYGYQAGLNNEQPSDNPYRTPNVSYSLREAWDHGFKDGAKAAKAEEAQQPETQSIKPKRCTTYSCGCDGQSEG